MSAFSALLKKDLRLMLSSKFFLLAFFSLLLYSCYINFFYVNIDQDTCPVYFYSNGETGALASEEIIVLSSMEELENVISDRYSVGIVSLNSVLSVKMVSSGNEIADNYRASYAMSLFEDNSNGGIVETVGNFNKDSKMRREITAEFLFFELAAVGFLGISSMLFKEKSMGVIRITGILPMKISMFIFSKLSLILITDIVFIVLLTLINLGVNDGLSVLPFVLLQGCILSLIMALIGFICSIKLHDFKQFSLFYLVLAVFITTPVFLAGQTNVTFEWINFHPMYHLFMSMKDAYFAELSNNTLYYIFCVVCITVLYFSVKKTMLREMSREG